VGIHESRSFLDANRSILDLAGFGLMVLFEWRMLRAKSVPICTNRLHNGSMLKYFLSAVLFMLLVGCFATAIGPRSLNTDNTGLLLGSAVWRLGLSSVIAALRTKVSPCLMRVSNMIAAVVMLGFSVTALVPVIM
jgi:hypothetical protein